MLKVRSLGPRHDDGAAIWIGRVAATHPADIIATLEVVGLRSVGVQLAGNGQTRKLAPTCWRLWIRTSDTVEIVKERRTDGHSGKAREGHTYVV